MDTKTSNPVQAPASPLPFSTNDDVIWDANDEDIFRAKFSERIQDAAYMAHAANCYPELVAALTDLLEIAESVVENTLELDDPDEPFKPSIMAQARAALDKANG